jgi:hypothetical protein
MPDLGEIMAFDMAFNKQIVQDGGEVIPRWVARNDKGESFVIATPWSGEEDKNKVVQFLRLFFMAHDITSYTFSAEAWMVKLEGKHMDAQSAQAAMDGLTPSQHPDRIEVINVVGADQHGEMLARVEIIRKGDDISFGPVEGMGEGQHRVEGRMTNLLPKPSDPPMPEALKAVLREKFKAMGVTQ